MAIPSELRREVVRRARNRCEYCGLSQEGQEATFHVDHIVPVAENGPTSAENLALACVSCSLKKGARQIGRDPETGQEARLFHPRKDRWSDHFQWEDFEIRGITEIGKATVEMLDLNRALICAIREEESQWGRHPPGETS